MVSCRYVKLPQQFQFPEKKSKSKKRKTSELSDEKLVGLMGTFCDQTNARLGDIAKRIGYEFDISEKRTAIYDALGKL